MPPLVSYYINSLECIKNSDVKITHKYTLGDLSMQTFCVRFDPNDKYIAAGNNQIFYTYIGCGDGTIRIFNVFTGKQSYVLNTNMEEPMPTTNIKYEI